METIFYLDCKLYVYFIYLLLIVASSFIVFFFPGLLCQFDFSNFSNLLVCLFYVFFFSVLQITFATIFISIHIKILGTLIYICVSYDRLKGYHIQLKLIRYVTSGSLTFFCHLSSFRRAMTSVFSSPTSTQSRCTNINWWTLSFISWRKLTRRSVK